MSNDIKVIKNNSKYIFLVVSAALVIRIVLACVTHGHIPDISCFYGWATRVCEVGITNFYSDDYFSDYPPGYIYILYIIGFLLNIFKCQFLSKGCLLLLKLPAIICDIITGIVIYCFVSKRKTLKESVVFSALYLFNPAVIYNSAIWGQVDSVYTLFIFLMCVLLYERKTISAYFVFAGGILIKPQMIMFSPLLIWGIYENVFMNNFDKKKFVKNLSLGLSTIGCMVIACLPFGFVKIISLYYTTMSSYPYVTVNAYNFWYMLGLNYISQDESFLGVLKYKYVGTIVILLICIIVAVIFFNRKMNNDRYWIAGAFIIITMFLFSVRMHERYIYPAMILLLMAYFANKDKRFLISYILISVLIYLNMWHVIKYSNLIQAGERNITAALIAFGIFILGIYVYCSIFIDYDNKIYKKLNLGLIEKFLYVSKINIVYIVCTVCYVFFTFEIISDFYRKVNTDILLNIPKGKQVASINCYLRGEKKANYYLYEWDDDKDTWILSQKMTFDNMYEWNRVDLNVCTTSNNIYIVTDYREGYIAELVLCDSDGNIIVPTNCSQYSALFDETELFTNNIFK